MRILGTKKNQMRDHGYNVFKTTVWHQNALFDKISTLVNTMIEMTVHLYKGIKGKLNICFC